MTRFRWIAQVLLDAVLALAAFTGTAVLLLIAYLLVIQLAQGG